MNRDRPRSSVRTVSCKIQTRLAPYYYNQTYFPRIETFCWCVESTFICCLHWTPRPACAYHLEPKMARIMLAFMPTQNVFAINQYNTDFTLITHHRKHDNEQLDRPVQLKICSGNQHWCSVNQEPPTLIHANVSQVRHVGICDPMTLSAQPPVHQCYVHTQTHVDTLKHLQTHKSTHTYTNTHTHTHTYTYKHTYICQNICA